MNAFITGASKGIGNAIARAFAAENINLCLVAREETHLKKLQSELKKQYPELKIIIITADCSIKTELQKAAALANDFFEDNIDILVNNAGLFLPGNLMDEPDENLHNQWLLNVMAGYYLYKIIAKKMALRQSGHIFNICSVASIENVKNASSYAVTKSAQLSLNNSMRSEMMDYGVKVTAIIPGNTYTSSWEGTTLNPDFFVQADDVASAIVNALKMSENANVEQIIIRPKRTLF